MSIRKSEQRVTVEVLHHEITGFISPELRSPNYGPFAFYLKQTGTLKSIDYKIWAACRSTIISNPSSVACVTRSVSDKGGGILRCLEAGR